jgi:hypothetical protein
LRSAMIFDLAYQPAGAGTLLPFGALSSVLQWR